MARTSNIAVITLGHYFKIAFEEQDVALQFMALLGKGVQVDDSIYSLNKFEVPHTHYLSKAENHGELKFIPAYNFNTSETVEEAKERLTREQKDREDLEQNMRQAPTPIGFAAPDELP